MSSCPAHLLKILALLASISGPALAQEDPANTSTPAIKELVVQNPPAVLNAEFAELIGEVGLKTPLKVVQPVLLSDLIAARCGSVADVYIKAIQTANDNSTLAFYSRLEKDTEIKLPPCPPAAQLAAVPKVVRKGDSFSDYWKTIGTGLPQGNFDSPGDADMKIVNGGVKVGHWAAQK